MVDKVVSCDEKKTMKGYFSVPFLILFTFLNLGKSQTPYDVNNLLIDLFTTHGYNNRVRPVMDQSYPIFLDVSLYLFSINEVDEVGERLVSTGFLYLSWVDELLQWNTSEHNDIDRIFLPQDDIWKPDLVLKNGFTKFEELGGKFYYVNIYFDGTVTWFPYQVFESRCSIDITYFPFDEQSCDIKFIAWSHSVDEIEIQRSSNGVEFYEFEENSVWTIVSTASVIKKESFESEITFTISLRRKPLFYIMNTIIPIVCLGVLNLLAFVIPADAGEKMSYSITVFLAFAVFLTIISTQLPSNSESTPILSMYLIIQLVYGVFVLIISSFQLRLRFRSHKQQISTIFKKGVSLQRRLRCESRRSSNKVQALKPAEPDTSDKHFIEPLETESEEIDWNDVSSTIDFFSFIFLFISDIAITSVMFAYAATKL